MTLWQQPAHLLPVRVRPIGGETVVSYVFRLAAANALTRPSTLLRALGDPLGVRPTAPMVHNCEVTLNAPALARLETFTGLPAARLRHALPGLSASRGDRLPDTVPTIRAFRSAAIRAHCHCCIARIPGRPQVRVRGHEAPSICRRHRRWVGTTSDHPDQIDLSGNTEIITADRRLGRLCSTVEDLAWVREQLWHANRIVTNWHRTRARFPTDTFANLHTRWDRRAATLPQSASATSLLVMPEAVALAEILCDLEWRRHVALSHYDHAVTQFYRRIARHLGQPARFGDLLCCLNRIDPLESWIIEHRRRFRAVRERHWRAARSHNPYSHNPILPTIRHFK